MNHPTQMKDGRRFLSVPDVLLTPESEVAYVYTVHHRFRRSFAASGSLFPEGTLVVLDGDRGLDMGVVERVVSREVYDKLTVEEKGERWLPPRLELTFPSFVYREATEDEARLYNGLLREVEKQTLLYLRQMASRQVYGTARFGSCQVQNMQFIECEMQADGQKLYVYYRTSQPVRFLELVAHLNQIFRCRIWMHDMQNTDFTSLMFLPNPYSSSIKEGVTVDAGTVSPPSE